MCFKTRIKGTGRLLSTENVPEKTERLRKTPKNTINSEKTQKTGRKDIYLHKKNIYHPKCRWQSKLYAISSHFLFVISLIMKLKATWILNFRHDNLQSFLTNRFVGAPIIIKTTHSICSPTWKTNVSSFHCQGYCLVVLVAKQKIL